MRDIKGLFFDMDGTLVDSFEANFEAYRIAIESVGREIDRARFAPSFGQNVHVFLPALFPDITLQEIESIKKEKARIHASLIHLVRPNQQLIDFLKSVRSHHTTALVTTASHTNVQTIVDSLKLRELFDYIITGDQVERHKPSPEAYLKALQLTQLSANEVLAFEDSKSGLEAAHAAGIHTIRIKISDTAL